MSSAWLIRRFVDPNATFAFGESAGRRNAVPFDVFQAELGHQGIVVHFRDHRPDFGIEDEAFTWFGRLVHDLDLRGKPTTFPRKPTWAGWSKASGACALTTRS